MGAPFVSTGFFAGALFLTAGAGFVVFAGVSFLSAAFVAGFASVFFAAGFASTLLLGVFASGFFASVFFCLRLIHFSAFGFLGIRFLRLLSFRINFFLRVDRLGRF